MQVILSSFILAGIMVKKSKKKHIDVKNSVGRADYKKVLKKIKKDKVCPFCLENFLTYHTEPILRQSRHWLITKNFKPYTGSTTHLLFVYTTHIEHISKLTKEGWDDLLRQTRWVSKKFNLKGETFFMRYGDTRYTGASVNHLHAQLISGGTHSTKGNAPIKTVIGFGKVKKKPPSL